MSAKILTLDIETQRAIVETFSIWKPFIAINRVIQPTRLLCLAAKWRGDEEVVFDASWTDPWNSKKAAKEYEALVGTAYDLLSEADYVVTWNGDRFDLQWIESECGRLGYGRPTPYKSIDLMKVNKKWFKGGQMSMKLDWTARQWLHDAKLKHGASDLWADIRYGDKDTQLAAQEVMTDYNIQDVVLTEQVLELYLPWTSINLALHMEDDGLPRCTKCGSLELTKQGKKVTLAAVYQQYRCKDCGSWSRDKRSERSTELRVVT